MVGFWTQKQERTSKVLPGPGVGNALTSLIPCMTYIHVLFLCLWFEMQMSSGYQKRDIQKSCFKPLCAQRCLNSPYNLCLSLGAHIFKELATSGSCLQETPTHMKDFVSSTDSIKDLGQWVGITAVQQHREQAFDLPLASFFLSTSPFSHFLLWNNRKFSLCLMYRTLAFSFQRVLSLPQAFSTKCSVSRGIW